MTDRDFDRLLYQSADQLPPRSVEQAAPAPWRRAMALICWGMALTTYVFHYGILEYVLPALRPGYYGFYYSLDDVPLAFQNVPVPLEETADGWTWRAEGDNHGLTRRLSPHWYYFEAHF